jgi:uncharacterized phage protein (TIGR01671 family)
MMREILFRGKTLENDKWVRGDYARYNRRYGDAFVIECYHNDEMFWDEIEPETLGQFTGCYDKNAEKIFEGDIVRLSLPLAKDLIYTTIGKIVYHESCAFICEVPSKGGEFPLSPNFEYEVIGNIYDNPELLEGESK